MANKNTNNTNSGINVAKTETKKNTIELFQEIDSDVTKIRINGQVVGICGYNSEADRKAMVKTIQAVVDGSDTAQEAIGKLNQIAELMDAGLDKNNVLEQVKVGTADIIIDYTARNARALCGEIVADLKDLGNVELPDEAIKTILIDRVKLAR